MMWLTIVAESIGHRKAEGSRKRDDRLECQVGRSRGWLAGWPASRGAQWDRRAGALSLHGGWVPLARAIRAVEMGGGAARATCS